MNATLYTGTSAAQSITNGVAGQSFQPDMVWCKSRSGAYSHGVDDVVRGAGNTLLPNTTDSEQAWSAYFTAFNSNGFSVASNGGTFNLSGTTYVAWQWKAGGTAVSNTSGTITSSVSANTTSGFSIVTYSGNSSAVQTVGHGLGVTPKFITIKQRTASGNSWVTYTSMTGAGNWLALNLTQAATTNTTLFNNTSPTSSVFTVGIDSAVNNTGQTYVAYCWSEIAGYSAFGSYTGNGSADGPFIYTGFRPKFVMIKNTGQANDWFLIDTSINPSNVVGTYLFPNTSAATSTYSWLDILSNGFKIRDTGTGNNNSSINYIYACFAENPFKYANAR
jgi:hypothetical protein